MLLLLISNAFPRQLIYNISPSLPLGWYLRKKGEEIRRGTIVEFAIPNAAYGYVGDRLGHVNPNWYILKKVLAVSGDHVSTVGDNLLINFKPVAPILTTDSRGKPMPIWRASRVLRRREYFVYSGLIINSFDSRYYGPISESDVRGVYVPLWTEKEKGSKMLCRKAL